MNSDGLPPGKIAYETPCNLPACYSLSIVIFDLRAADCIALVELLHLCPFSMDVLSVNVFNFALEGVHTRLPRLRVRTPDP
jgi:hypothetical protein